MKLPEISIRRPVLATVVNIILILLGLVAYDRLQVREYPKIDLPTVNIETTWKGANAEIMETQVTKLIEDAVAGIEGIDFISSTTRAEESQVTVNFVVSRDPDDAAADVRDRVGRVRSLLPDEVDEPVIAKTEADAQPIIYIAMSSDRQSALEVSDIADRVVQDRLQTVNGVANALIFGERRYSMRIWLNPDKMAGYSITPSDVETAIRAQNVEIPAGRIEGLDREFTVQSQTDLRTPEEFAKIILRQSDGYLVRLGDVARIEIGPEDKRVVARYNGEPAIAIGIVKQSTANPLEVSQGVQKAIEEIRPTLPPGMTLEVAYDSTIFISASLDAVVQTILEAVAFVTVVIFLFLRSWRATLVPLATIPISLLGALLLMYGLDFSINTLTLLAFVLAIGLVVDDAIVMLENISRYVEQGMKPMQAALKGSKEIAFAVLAMTLTLAAVYAPIGLAEGRTGKLFTEFALALAGAVLVSGFVALTLTPMMCSKLLRHEHNPGWFYTKGEDILNGLTAAYKGLLAKALGHRLLVMIVAGMLGAGSYGLFTLLPNELAPIEDRGVIVGVGFAPEGSTVDYTSRYAEMAEQIYNTVDDRYMYFMVTGYPVVSQIISFLRLKDWSERDVSAQQVAANLGGPLFGIPGVMMFPVTPPSLGQDAQETPINFIIQTTGSWGDLGAVLGQVMAKIGENPRLMNVRPDLQPNKPELVLDVNRDKVADVGASIGDVGRTLETFLGGRDVTRFKKDGEQYDVILQLDDSQRRKPDDLTGVFVRGTGGQMVQMANLLNVRETVTPRELNHFNKLRAVTLTATLAPGYSMGEALAFLKQTVDDVAQPGISVDYGGQSREFMQSASTIGFVFLLALAFIYLVLAAQFESFIDPFIILLSVPLALFGALYALFLTGNSLNIYSQIGLITLVGLIAKNGILIVEFANQLQEEGRQKLEAVMESASLRLRPILMTTAAMVLGALPLAISAGAGAESRATIGWVIIGGMTIGTLFTLFVVPVVYSLLATQRQHHAAEEAIA